MAYVHGYSERETQRLYEQADILEEVLHTGTAFPANAKVLESGCGVGAQTRLLVKRSPDAVFTCIDISEKSLATANRLKEQAGFDRVTFRREDIARLSFADEAFDHIFLCFVLEHLDAPVVALAELKRVLKTGGTNTVIEGITVRASGIRKRRSPLPLGMALLPPNETSATTRTLDGG